MRTEILKGKVDEALHFCSFVLQIHEIKVH